MVAMAYGPVVAEEFKIFYDASYGSQARMAQVKPTANH
jgi:hypothetical protein